MLARLDNRHTEVTEQVAVNDSITDPVLSISVETDTSFWADAACSDGAGSLAGLFFSAELGDIAAAKHICAACPVLAQCLEGALARKEPWGVWGGQLFLNGKIRLVKRRRGRPPKRPRPEDDLPHVAIPVELLELVSRRTA